LALETSAAEIIDMRMHKNLKNGEKKMIKIEENPFQNRSSRCYYFGMLVLS